MIYSIQMQIQVNWKTILLCLVLFSGMLSVLIFSKNKQTFRSRASGTVVLRLIPGTVTSRVGETFSLAVLLDTKEDTVAAVDLVVAYDEAVIHAVGTNPSEQFPVVLSPGSVGGGKVHVVLGTDPASPQRGAVPVATLRFEALRKGVTTIATTNQSAVAAVGKSDNVLSQTYPATVTIPSLNQTARRLPSSSPSPIPDGFLQKKIPRPQRVTPTLFPYQNDRIPTPPKSPFPAWLDAIFQAIANLVCRVAPCGQ